MQAGNASLRLRAAPWLGMLLAATLGLAGCAGLASKPAPIGTGAQGILSDISDYHGRFAVRYVDSVGADRNVYGNFDLRQDAAETTLDLINPLGQTLARVTVQPSGATLELPGKAPQSAPEVETLMQHAIGFPLPLAGLRYWLRPQAAPDTPAQVQRDPASGRYAQIQQDGWTIDYLAYDTSAPATAAGTAPLKRVNLSRTDPSLEVKLVIDR